MGAAFQKGITTKNAGSDLVNDKARFITFPEGLRSETNKKDISLRGMKKGSIKRFRC